MLRVQRELTDVEMIDALNEIIDLIIDCYHQPVREEFKNACRASQIGKDITDRLRERDILARYANIGYESQQILLTRDMIKTGGLENG